MTRDLNVFGVVLARSGSKGVKSKNLLKLGNETLIERSVRVALKSELLTDLIFTTDDKGYADIALSAGANSIVFRPSELSDDFASSWDVVRHAIVEVEKTKSVKTDLVVLLQPTTPFRTPFHIDEAVRAICDGKAQAAMTIKSVDYPVEWMFWLDENKLRQPILDPPRPIKRRQDSAGAFQPAGTVYAVTRERLFTDNPMVNDSLYCIEVPYNEAVNIDTIDDYIIAKAFWDEYDERLF